MYLFLKILKINSKCKIIENQCLKNRTNKLRTRSSYNIIYVLFVGNFDRLERKICEGDIAREPSFSGTSHVNHLYGITPSKALSYKEIKVFGRSKW